MQSAQVKEEKNQMEEMDSESKSISKMGVGIQALDKSYEG
jgi:hypothetical protein